MGGSGGNSGAISYQEYLTNFHRELLSNDVFDPVMNVYIDSEINAIVASNPFASKTAYVPDTRTTEIQDEFDAMKALSIDTSDEFIFEAVNSFTDSHRLRLMQATNRVAGMFFDINAVVGTAYPAALALLEIGFNRDITHFKVEANKARANLALRAVDMQHNISRTKLAAEIDEDKLNLTYDIEEDYWSLNALLKGGSAMGLIGGGQPGGRVEDGPSGAQSVLGGMATGAAIGTAVSPEAPLIGAGVGAVVGGLAGLFG